MTDDERSAMAELANGQERIAEALRRIACAAETAADLIRQMGDEIDDVIRLMRED